MIPQIMSANSQTYINGNKIDSQGILLDYNGDNVKISGYDNNNQYYAQLSNDEIFDLLAIPASSTPLEQRLEKLSKSPTKSRKKTKRRSKEQILIDRHKAKQSALKKLNK